MKTALPLSSSQPATIDKARLRRHGLSKPPFEAVADADSHYSDLALDIPIKILLNHLHNNKSLLVLIGDHGVGKSTQLLHLLAAGTNDLLFCAFKARSDTGFAAIEQTIRQHWAQSVQRNTTTDLEDVLSTLCHGKRRPVLVVDDAHQLKPEVLGALLQLSRTVQRQCGRTPGIVLAGEAYLETLLERSVDSFIILKNRIKITLNPLTAEQTEAYLRLRLQAAGAKNPDMLSGEVAEAIYQQSLGYPLEINAAANRYLWGSETQDKSPTIEQQDNESAHLPPDTGTPRRTSRPRWLLPTAVGILTTVTATAALYFTLQSDSLSWHPSEVLSSLTSRSLPEPTPEPRVAWQQTSQAESTVAVSPVSEAVSENADTARTEPGTAVASQPDTTETTVDPAALETATEAAVASQPDTESSVDPALETAPETAVASQPDTESGVDPALETAPEATVASQPDTESSVDPVLETAPERTVDSEPDTESSVDPVLETAPERTVDSEPTVHIDAAALAPIPIPQPTDGRLDERWLRQQNPNHLTIQIAASDDLQALREYAASLTLNTELTWFRSRRNGRDWYSLVTGQYPNSASAQTALANLPTRVRRNQPWIRNFGSIQQDIDNAR